MKMMRLNGMARAFQNALESDVKNLTTDELIAHLIDVEWDDRNNLKIQNIIKQANFRYNALLAELDFSVNRNLDKNLVLRLSECSWIKKSQNIIITGPTGSGKSHVDCALGYQSVINGFKVSYFNCSKLFSLLKFYKDDATYFKKLEKIGKTDILILDDFGLQTFDKPGRISLLEILEDRYNKKSTVIVSQLPVKNWHDIIGDSTIADAICDRLVHNSYKIDLKGVDSMRKIYGKNLD